MTRGTVWITGASGFVGRHLEAALRRDAWTVVGFGRSGGQALTLAAGGVDWAIAEHGLPTWAFHLAGGATVGQSISDPLGDFESNVATTAHFFDAVRQRCPDCPVVVASSSAVYGGGHTGAIATDAALQPFSPYGQHKRMAELLAQSYAESFGLRAVVLRFFSIYGPELRKQLLFDICTQLARSEAPVRLGGTGAELRDWCHVDDAVRAMTCLAVPPPGTVATFNIGSGKGVAVRDVAARLLAYWGGGRKVVFSGQSRPGDPFCLVAARNSLPPGFSPRVALDEGFAAFVDWFKAEGAGGRAA